MQTSVAIAIGIISLGSLALARRAGTPESFFRGFDGQTGPPRLATLVLSQVTTWIFARSLLNAAILGYFFGIMGTLAYAAYYLSFLTGAAIVDSVRFRHGFDSVHAFLSARFGRAGTVCFNVVIGIRLLSEVFANLIVVGLIFGGEGTTAYVVAVTGLAAVGFAYSMLGGLRTSLRTDVIQATLLILVLAAMSALLLLSDGFSGGAVLRSSPDLDGPGWVLLAVALLQVVSYPMHDPVMMDRGFMADRRTTRASFLHAAWISSLCIVAFGLLGVHAGLNRVGEEAMLAGFERLFGAPMMLLVYVALVVSALSTLDSALSSAAKLSVVDMGIGRPTIRNGRIAMAAFMAGGLGFLFLGSDDLFAAVAVSGTASMFLLPTIVLSLWAGRTDIPVWSYVAAFGFAVGGAALYFLENSGYTGLVGAVTGLAHSYSKLLAISLAVAAGGFAAYGLGIVTNRIRARYAPPP